MRNGWIDIGRFVFALLVVFIHVPMRGSIYLWPFARCAVPFFFLIAGYFCYSDDSLQFKNSINKNYKKWFFLWLKYTSMIISVVIVINYMVGLQNVTFPYVDIINFFKEGACSLVDVVTYKN